jgi:hypothetical protein
MNCVIDFRKYRDTNRVREHNGPNIRRKPITPINQKQKRKGGSPITKYPLIIWVPLILDT